jgi:DNA-binding LacI/PurR family transcriptional regulator
MIKLAHNDPRPLYQQVKASLRDFIMRGAVPAGVAIPDERSLAAGLGLSRMTVRRAIAELTGEGLFTRIPGRGTFVADGIAGSLSAPAEIKKLTSIGLISLMGRAEMASALFYHRIVQSIQQNLDVSSPLVMIKPAADAAAMMSAISSDSTLCGLIVLGIVDRKVIDAVGTLKLPVVLVDSAQPAKRRLDEVTHNGEPSCFEAVTALIEQGHRDIAIMNYVPSTAASKQRQDAYEAALRASKIPVRDEFIYQIPCSATAAYAQFRRVLKSKSIPSAVFCTTDELAVAVISAVKDHGWRVPEHMSVVGFGDLGYFSTPALSSIRLSLEQMGTSAVKLLTERIQNPAIEPRLISVPTEWMSRASCDLPRESDLSYSDDPNHAAGPQSRRKE